MLKSMLGAMERGWVIELKVDKIHPEYIVFSASKGNMHDRALVMCKHFTAANNEELEAFFMDLP